ncbi:cupin, partial [Mesorhizobium sp. M8A.F.Ca.ET.023.01.1.1]
MAEPKFLAVGIDTVDAEHGAPAADRLISGDPKFRTWNVEERDGGLYAGIW